MLCGISSRFQLLSPSERQVAHALLTRPPLSLPLFHPKIPRRSFVRLACVRHAASVRPEPGSNSLKYCIKTAEAASTYFRAQSLFSILTYHFFFRCILCSFRNYCVRVLLSPKKSRVPFPSLFNFQGSCAARSSQTALQVYHFNAPLSTPFFKFFYSFFDSFFFHKILRFPADFLCFLRTARAPAAGPFRVDKAAPARKPDFFLAYDFRSSLCIEKDRRRGPSPAAFFFTVVFHHR